ncbi:MAG: hypothetical protein GW893_10415 [Armatimonadetes bacterium]|nr:hypothetical protein [Armatimonadota bacterium]
MSEDSRSTHLLHFSGAILALTMVVFRLLQPQSENIPTLAWVWGAASFAYLASVLLTARSKQFHLRWVILWAILMRLPAIGHAPSLTTDYHRYLWDGRIQQHGINPFQLSPLAPSLRPLRDNNWEGINFKRVSTIYPPTSQFVFHAAGRLGGREAMRLLFLGFEMLAWFGIVALLRRRKEPEVYLVWFAWCPLVVLEVAFNLHQDIIGVGFLLTALTTDGVACGALLALSILAKGYSLTLLPLVAGRREKRLLFSLGLTALLTLLPFGAAGARMFRGLKEYLELWRGHGTVFPALVELCAHWTAHPERVVVPVVLLALLVSLAFIRRRVIPAAGLPVGCGAAMGVLILLSPVVYPWYLLWVVAFLPFTRSVPWAAFSCTILLAYTWFLRRTPITAIVWWEYTPFVLTYAIVRLNMTRQRQWG